MTPSYYFSEKQFIIFHEEGCFEIQTKDFAAYLYKNSTSIYRKRVSLYSDHFILNSSIPPQDLSVIVSETIIDGHHFMQIISADLDKINTYFDSLFNMAIFA